MTIRYSFLLSSVLLSGSIVTACTPGQVTSDGHSFRVFEENGVNTSESSGGPKYTEQLFRFEEIFELKQDESRPETLLNSAGSFLMDEEGQVFVFDMRDARVVVFDQNGNYLRDIGRKGSGPGEFNIIRPCWLMDGMFAVYDFQQFRASVFTTDGRLLKIHTRAGASNVMMAAPVMRSLRSVYPLPDGRAVQLFDEYTGFGTEEQDIRRVALLVSADGDSLQLFRSDTKVTPQHPSKYGGVVTERTMFTSYPNIMVHPVEGILITDGLEPVLRWYGFDGSLKRILRLGLEPEPVTDEEKTLIERNNRDQIQNAEAALRERLEERWRYMSIPDFKSYWADILVDDQGFHWLRNHENWTLPEEEQGKWTHKVFNPEGEYLGTSTWPSRVSSISGGHFIGRRLDEETDGYRYVVYRIIPVVEGLEY